MGNEEKYPDGKCEVCDKVFPRPNGFRTETESSHEKDCKLKEIKEIIKSGEEFDRFEIIYDLEYISKVSSFGCRFEKGTNTPIKNKYYLRVLECNKIIKKLKEDSPKP